MMTVADLKEALDDLDDDAVVLHAVVRHSQGTIILTAGFDDEDEDEDEGDLDLPEDED